MRVDGNAVLSGLTAEETGSRRSSCMPVSQGARTYLRALATIIKRERARENMGRKTQKWQSRSLGPPRVLTSSAKGENVLRPRSVPSTYAFLPPPPPPLLPRFLPSSHSLTSSTSRALQHPFRDGHSLVYSLVDETRDSGFVEDIGSLEISAGWNFF